MENKPQSEVSTSVTASENGGSGVEQADGWFKCPRALIFDTNLTGTEKLVLLALLAHSDDNGESWPSAQTIAKEAGITWRWTIKTLEELERKKAIKIAKRPGFSSRYKVVGYELSSWVGMNSVHGCGGGVCTEFIGGMNSVHKGYELSSYERESNNKNQEQESISPLPPLPKTDVPKTEKTDGGEMADETPKKRPRKKAPDESVYDADFEAFYNAYPSSPYNNRSRGKANYIKLRKQGVTADDLLKSAKNYANSRIGEDRNYTKGVGNFLSIPRGEKAELGFWAGYKAPNLVQGKGMYHPEQSTHDFDRFLMKEVFKNDWEFFDWVERGKPNLDEYMRRFEAYQQRSQGFSGKSSAAHGSEMGTGGFSPEDDNLLPF